MEVTGEVTGDINLVIIGAGQLGSRHLQSIASSNYNIFVVDPSGNSLQVARDRFNEVNQSFRGNISFLTSVEGLPSQIELGIIATNSKVRAQVIETLLSNCHVKNLILEKVLFPVLSEYQQIQDLLNKTQTKCWVNCPLRILPVYQNIKEALVGERIQLQVVGNGWGLGCNGIHYLDLFSYLTGNSDLTLHNNNLDKSIQDSKRNGYIEFTGSMQGYNKNGDSFSLTSNSSGSGGPLLITITSEKSHYVIHQTNKFFINKASVDNNWQWEKAEYPLLYQSQLTMPIVREIFAAGTCGLTTFKESVKLHTVFISSLLQFTSLIENRKVEICQIT